MLPNDTQGRRILAIDRQRLLSDDAPARGAGRLRRRLAGLLVSAGVRLAPDAASGLRRPGVRGGFQASRSRL